MGSKRSGWLHPQLGWAAAMATVLLACGQTERDTGGAGTAGSGGSSGGTTASSGGTSGGASGTNGQPQAYPIPDHCSAGEPIASGEGCELPVACDEVTVVATCRDSGVCRCDIDGPRDIWLQAVSPEQRCLAAASICLAPPEFTDWRCPAPGGEFVPGSHCSARWECERSATVGGDVSVTQRQVHTADCNAREAGVWECDCTLPDRSDVRFSIEGDAVCQDVLDACLHDRFDREGPRRCAFLDSGADEFGCHIWRECSQDASFDGASITLREQLLLSCGPVGDGEWKCDCPAGRGSLEIDDDDPAQACQIAEAVCLTDEEMGE